MDKNRFEVLGLALVVMGCMELARAAGFLTVSSWHVGIAWIITGVIVLALHVRSYHSRTNSHEK